MFGEFPEQWITIRDFMRTFSSGFYYDITAPEQSESFGRSEKNGDFARSGLSEAVSAFLKNVSRLHSHVSLLSSMFSYGRRVHEQIELQLRARGINSEASLYPDNVAAWAEIHQDVIRWICSPISVQETQFHPSQLVETFPDGWLAAGFAAIPEHNRGTQISSFQSSLIVEAWTIFECLSEDLWEAAVNSHPAAFGRLNNKLKFTYEDLEKINFDVHTRLGTMAKRKSEVIGFRSLGKIADSYELAFFEQRKQVGDVLADHGLRYAVAARNAIVHRRGLLDLDFNDQTAGIADVPRYDPMGSSEQPLPMSGELCARLAGSCCGCAVRLVNVVHALIIRHTANRRTQQGPENCGESNSESCPQTPL